MISQYVRVQRLLIVCCVVDDERVGIDKGGLLWCSSPFYIFDYVACTAMLTPLAAIYVFLNALSLSLPNGHIMR